MYTKIAQGICLLGIGWQLVSLPISVPIKDSSYGDIRARATEAKEVALPQPALTASSEMSTYRDIVFVGDVMLARNVEYVMNTLGADYPFGGVSLSAHAHTPAIVGNFESSMADSHTQTPPLTMRFSVSPLYVSALKTAGFTHLSLANNHSLDYGDDGYARTQEALHANDLQTFGHYSDVSERSVSYIDTESGRIAIVGIHATAAIPNKELLNTVFKTAATQSTFQVAYIHWGTEYELVHSKAQESIAKTLVAAGADIIIGHHPHVVQDIGLIEGVPVFYSLGNYVFDQYFSRNVQEGLVVALEISNTATVKLLPVSSEKNRSQPALMESAQRASFLTALAQRSQPDLRDAILDGEIPLVHLVATSTEMAIMVP